MIIAGKGFNTYLLFLFFLLFVTGCQSPERKARQRLTVLDVHLESRDLPERQKIVSVYRERPFTISVQNEPFLTQNDVQEARVIEVVGGFAIRLQFVQRGARLLEQYSSGNPGKHLAIFSQFVTPPKETLNEGRWLAAPRINHRITDGVLVFTPDATREEAEQIVLGLNNVVRKLKKERWLPEN